MVLSTPLHCEACGDNQKATMLDLSNNPSKIGKVEHRQVFAGHLSTKMSMCIEVQIETGTLQVIGKETSA